MSCPLPASRSLTSPLRRVVGAGLALATLLGTAAIVRSQLPLREAFPGGDRFAFYLEHRDDYNVVFLGNSLIYRGVVPSVFDARMAEHGYRTRSFNLAYSAMRVFESEHLLRRLVRSGNPPDFLILGRGAYGPKIGDWERRTWRIVAWHTTRQTMNAVRAAWQLEGTLAEKLDSSLAHAALWCQWATTYGGGPLILEGWARTPEAEAAAWAGLSESGGYQALEGLTGGHVRQRRARFLKRQQRYLNSLERNQRRRRALDRRSELDFRALVELAELGAEAGAKPVLLVSPNVGGFANLDLEAKSEFPVLNFDRPAEYPELFDPQLRFDRTHLSREGAEIYSRLVADAFAEVLAGGPN